MAHKHIKKKGFLKKYFSSKNSCKKCCNYENIIIIVFSVFYCFLNLSLLYNKINHFVNLSKEVKLLTFFKLQIKTLPYRSATKVFVDCN